MKKIFALLLAVMLVISMAACGKTDTAPTTAPTTAPEKEPEPAGTLYVTFGATIEMVFDSNCETISITGTNDLGKRIADANQNQLNKGCVFALRAILRYASDNSLLGDAKAMTIRVGAKKNLPKEDFLEEIQTDCQYLADEECTGIRIVPLIGDMLDSDGNITAATAKNLACRFMEAADADVTGGDVAVDGIFTFVCGERSCTVDAFTGLVKAAA